MKCHHYYGASLTSHPFVKWGKSLQEGRHAQPFGSFVTPGSTRYWLSDNSTWHPSDMQQARRRSPPSHFHSREPLIVGGPFLESTKRNFTAPSAPPCHDSGSPPAAGADALAPFAASAAAAPRLRSGLTAYSPPLYHPRSASSNSPVVRAPLPDPLLATPTPHPHPHLPFPSSSGSALCPFPQYGADTPNSLLEEPFEASLLGSPEQVIAEGSILPVWAERLQSVPSFFLQI